jgi:TetR/AcrR family transcriptional regulator, fatty acid metabolism regulator protein
MTNTRMSTEKRQEQIIQTAMKIINEEGYLALTTRRIAEVVGISEPALYRHFGSKDMILIGIIKKMDDLWSRIEDNLQVVNNNRDRLSLFIRMHFDYFEHNPDIVSVLFVDEYVRLNENVSKYLIKVKEQRAAFLSKLVQKIPQSNDIPNNDVALATIVIGTIRMAIMQWHNSEHKISLNKHGNTVRKVLLSMVFPEENQNQQ